MARESLLGLAAMNFYGWFWYVDLELKEKLSKENEIYDWVSWTMNCMVVGGLIYKDILDTVDAHCYYYDMMI